MSDRPNPWWHHIFRWKLRKKRAKTNPGVTAVDEWADIVATTTPAERRAILEALWDEVRESAVHAFDKDKP